MRFAFITPLLLVVLASCNKAARPNYALRDSAVAHHFRAISRLRYYDTSELDYKLLQAVYLNDTNYFKNYLGMQPEEHDFSRPLLMFDSLLQLQPVDNLDADEAYRFEVENSFTVLSSAVGYPVNMEVVTFATKGDVTNMQVILGEYKPSANDWTHGSIDVHYRRDKTIPSSDWDSVRHALLLCDFWGLKTNSDYYDASMDGAIACIDGYRKGFTYTWPMSHHVFRDLTSHSPIHLPFELVARVMKRQE